MKMKNIFYASAIFAAVLLTASCDKMLNQQQDGAISFSNMWQDASDVTSSTTGIYYRMRACFAQDEMNVFYWGEARVGEYMWGPGIAAQATDANKRAVLLSNMTGATSSCGWSALYTTIDQANSVIKYAPTVSMPESEKNRCLGQAYFARAYCYFWAARLWGDVPMNLVPVESTSQPETYPERTEKAKVYEQIGKDIEETAKYESVLGSDKYFATPAALHMLDAEYSLWMYSTQNGGEGYLTRAENALKALNAGASNLSDNYGDTFDRTKKTGKEVIFALKNDMSENTGGYYWYFYHPTSDIASQYVNKPVPAYKTQWWSYSQNFVDILLKSKEAGDKRVGTNLGYGNYRKDGSIISWPNKFLGDMSGALVTLDCDLMYYRYAQAIMMNAELKYYKKDYAGVMADLNIIAKRAYGKDNFYKTTGATKDEALAALVNEYFLEFPCEGVIWWALIRLDKIWDYNPALKTKKASNPNILLWPITNSALNKNNKLSQTEGWS